MYWDDGHSYTELHEGPGFFFAVLGTWPMALELGNLPFFAQNWEF